MARVLFTSARHTALVINLLQAASAMVARGDEVWFLGGEQHRGLIEAAGAHFVRLPYDESIPVTRVAHERPMSGVSEITSMLRTLFFDTIETDLVTVRRLATELRIDLVVTEPLFVGATALGLLPRDARPAVLSVGCFPLPMTDPAVAPYGLGLTPIDGPLNALRNRALAAIVDRAVVRPVRLAFQAEVERLIGVRVEGALFDMALSADAYAHASVAGFEYPRAQLSPKVRFVGPFPAPSDHPLPEWWDYRDPRRIVHVTQGTYANDDFEELVVPTIRALAEEDLLVVATTGGPDAGVVESAFAGGLPGNARVERFMPYDHLLAASAVMVTNGGFGAVHHAARRGLPLVVAGRTEDKAEVNARVAWTGIGVDLKAQRPEPSAIRRAVLDVLAHAEQHRRAAARLGAAIAATDAVAAILSIADELTGSSANDRDRRTLTT